MELNKAIAAVRRWADWPGVDRLDDPNNPVPMRAIMKLVEHATPTPLSDDAEEVIARADNESLRQMLCEFDDYLNEPPRLYRIEPMEVRDYRNEAYRKWAPLCRAILSLLPQEKGNG